MGTDQATLRITSQLQHVLDNMNSDLDRIEILTAALAGFSSPVPEYEPAFHHLNPATLRKYQLGSLDDD